MIPARKYAFARWIFGANHQSDSSYVAGHFTFSETEKATTVTGASLTWDEYCQLLFRRWLIRRGEIEVGQNEGGPVDEEAFERAIMSATLSRADIRRLTFARWLVERGKLTSGGAEDGLERYPEHADDTRPRLAAMLPTATKNTPDRRVILRPRLKPANVNVKEQ